MANKIKRLESEVIADFRVSDLYTDEFLADFEGGLRKSSYTKKAEILKITKHYKK